MWYGRIIKPGDKLWNSSEALPHFCNEYRVKGCKGMEYHYGLSKEEFLWSQKNEKKYLKNNCQGEVDLLCAISVAFFYDLDDEYDDKAKEYNRFCLEELNFQILHFDECNWADVRKLCTIREADDTIQRIRDKMIELHFSEDDIKYCFENSIFRVEQVACPRCNSICSMGDTYCYECGLVVGLELVDWSKVEYTTK